MDIRQSLAGATLGALQLSICACEVKESLGAGAPLSQPQTKKSVAQGPPPRRASESSRADEPPCPPEMAFLGRRCVDRYEAHLVTISGDGNVVVNPYYARPVSTMKYIARSRAGVKPQAYVSQVEAGAACAAAGKQLCSIADWRAACRGPSQTTYPYGERFERNRCNVGRPHILSELFGKDPRAWTYEHFNDPRLAQEGALLPTADSSGCTNGYEVFDMVGNLHEWVADRVDRTLPDKVPLQPGIARTVPRKHGFGVFMGGFFSTTNQHGRGCDFITIAHEPKYHDYSTGFRCCADAARPSSGDD